MLNFDQESASFIVTLDKNTGKELWRSERDEASAWAMPLVVKTGKLGREGDLTGTDAILWTNKRGNSYTPSPVLHDGILRRCGRRRGGEKG